MPHDDVSIKGKLAAPFDDPDIEWRLQSVNKEKTSGKAVPYVTNRAIQNRLDSVVGVDCWKNEYIPWHNDGKKASQLCGISIYFKDRNEWVAKYDGAEDTDIEPIKGGLSDSMKRAAVQWGIGRYLYEMDVVNVEIELWNDKPYIKRGEQAKMDKAHQRAVQRVFGFGQPASPSQKQGPAPQTAPQLQQATRPPNPATAAQQAALLPKQSPQIEQPAAMGQPAEGQARQKPWPPFGLQQKQAAENAYCVVDAVSRPSMNSMNTHLKLKSPDGSVIMAFAQGEKPELKPGTWIENAVITQKMKNEVVFKTLDSYNLALAQAA